MGSPRELVGRSCVAVSSLGQSSHGSPVRRMDADALDSEGDHAQEADSRTLIQASLVAREAVLGLAAFEHEL